MATRGRPRSGQMRAVFLKPGLMAGVLQVPRGGGGGGVLARRLSRGLFLSSERGEPPLRPPAPGQLSQPETLARPLA